MKSIEKTKSMKQKTFAPVAAAIGKFSTAFRQFETHLKEERSNSIETSTPASQTFKAKRLSGQ